MYKNRDIKYLVNIFMYEVHSPLMQGWFRRVKMKYDIKKEKAIRLENSTLLDIHKLSEYKEVDNCVAYLFDILSKKIDKFKRKNPSKNKSQLKTLIVNLYQNYLDDKTRYVSINLGKSYYEN